MNHAIQIKNAYAILKQTYNEVSYLIQDFGAELKRKGFVPAHTGIECERSNKLNRSNRWIPPWFSRYYKNKDEKQGYIGFSVIFRDHNEEAITPKLLLGVFPEFENYHRWWISSMYSSEEIKIFSLKEDGKIKANTLPGDYLLNWVTVGFEGPKPDENWYNPAYLFAKELVEVDNRDEIGTLAQNVITEFNMVNEQTREKP